MPLRHEQHARGVEPFDIVDCPLCDSKDFVSMDHASVFCDNCNCQFFVRHTAGDPGFVVDALFRYVYWNSTKYTELKDIPTIDNPYFIHKVGEDRDQWIVASKQEGLDLWEKYIQKKLVKEQAK